MNEGCWWLMVDMGHICCKAIIGTKKIVVLQDIYLKIIGSISYKLLHFVVVWMEICLASSASGSTVSFLPVPEEGLGFTMRLF